MSTKLTVTFIEAQILKHLFLIRHAKSSWADDRLDDHQRPLTDLGKRQIEVIARPLLDTGAFAGRVYASDAVRARETANGLIRKAVTAQRDIQGDTEVRFIPALYTADANVLIKSVRDCTRDDKTLTLIGHNPALLDLAGYLIKHPPVALPTGSFIKIELPIKSWRKLKKHQGKLALLLTPKDVSFEQFKRKHNAVSEDDSRPLTERLPAALEHQYEWIRDLEPGVINGYDDEFLHQYRIALRRSRAIAESVLEITGNKPLNKAVKLLRHHARATSTLRDLNVFLLEWQQWQDTGAGQELAALEAETYFHALARAQHRRLTKRLQSDRYRNTMKAWRKLITSRQFRNTTNMISPTDIQQALHNRIAIHNRLATALTTQSADDEIHRLRKLVKRIRYLAELDTQTFGWMLGELKQRQQLFGTFQDLHVQIELLTGFQSSSEAGQSTLSGATGALTQLMATLETQKTYVRNRILALGHIEVSETPL